MRKRITAATLGLRRLSGSHCLSSPIIAPWESTRKSEKPNSRQRLYILHWAKRQGDLISPGRNKYFRGASCLLTTYGTNFSPIFCAAGDLSFSPGMQKIHDSAGLAAEDCF
jgi:hypothetical protein